MNLDYAQKLGLKIQKTNIKAQKIEDSILKTFKIVIADFQVKDKIDRSRFFQKTFLMANIKFEVILKIFFLKLSNVDILLNEKTLT